MRQQPHVQVSQVPDLAPGTRLRFMDRDVAYLLEPERDRWWLHELDGVDRRLATVTVNDGEWRASSVDVSGPWRADSLAALLLKILR